MEIELKGIDFDANIYDIYEAVELVLHGPDLYDPKDRENKGRKPNFEVVLGESPAGRIHNGTATLRVPDRVGKRLLRWYWDSPKHKIIVYDWPLRLFDSFREVPPDVAYRLEKGLYINPRKGQARKKIEDVARQVRLRIAKIQFGLWYMPSDPPPKQRRTFSIEYERDYLTQSAAYISLVYEDSVMCIDVSATFSWT
jgi:RNA-dependent RNA polymerase